MNIVECNCLQCLRGRSEGEYLLNGTFIPAENMRMILCPVCGNKRCPHAMHHIHPCTHSNECNQSGSR